ncbi:FxDxF family PEP-CTERM protein [Rugamonas sp. CCM 8940]|uniref:FxDxF family PEP-CTERM protein n=1 Tax=Rugamonas sp. CCM 8940 TaxID=2765359 RepID=UPI0018F5454C|nr:FxDxF family PEP-CTERM protein [Rugamonas sp. CCM 8940]MBJ7311436.1 FxDxF family PEP-CTERM protein [Rugamonas sp. CCM 8940]
MKKSFSTVLMALAFAGSACVAQSAHAAVDISKAAAAVTLPNGGSASFGDKFKNNQATNFFGEKFTFTTTGLTDVDMIVTSTSTKAENGLNLTGFALFDGRNHQVSGGQQLLTGIEDKWTLSAKHLAAGSYYFLVSGNVVSNTGGAFGANGSVLSAVPEADTYAMLLAGLGLLGLVARRRGGKAA